MPRVAKESEDEGEMKIGRRTRATAGASVVDSPLRRSTRHKPPMNQDDGSSPESIASDAAVPPARSTRSKIATMEYPTSDNIRSLRPRKNSTASDTADFPDGETSGDVKKRNTRRSTTAMPLIETPTKVRLRRTSRAGSESKTMSPVAVRTTRRTRASSVDLEDSNETSRDKLLMIHLDTPLKMRNRASALPSEPSVVEEPDNIQTEVLDNDGHDPENTSISNNSSMDRTKSPASQAKLEENQVTAQKELEDTSARESTTMQLCDDVFDNPSNNSSTSPFNSKTDIELREKLISEMDLPKIVLYKTDVPAQKSPGNKENEKSNIIIPDKKFEISDSEKILSQRKSENFTTMKKLQMEERLNRSVDDRSLMNIHSQSMSMLSSSDPPSRCEPLETSIKKRSLPNIDTASVTISSKNESIIFLEEKIDISDYKESVDDNSNEETIHLEPQLRRKSLTNISQQSPENNSVIEIDTTVDNLADSTDNISIDVRSEGVETSEATKENSTHHSTAVNVSQHIVEDNNGDSSLLLRKSIGKNTQITESLVESLNTPDSELHNVSENSINIENENTTKHNERRSSLNQHKSPRPSETRKSSSEIENGEKKNVSNDEDIETDVENLFQDISAEEWKATQSITDECSNVDDVEQGETSHQDMFTDRKSWTITRKDRASKLQDTSDYDSDDTVIMQITNAQSKSSEAPHFATIQEQTDVVEDDDDTEIDQSIVQKSQRKSLSKSRQNSVNGSSEHNENNEKTATVDKQLDQVTPPPSKRKSYEKQTRQMQMTEATDSGKNLTDIKIGKSASRKSLNIKSLDSNNDNKLKRRTIEKMDSTKCHKSHRQSISTIDNAMDIDENVSDGQNELEFSEKSTIKHKRRSSNVFARTPEKQPVQNLMDEEMDTDDNDRPLLDKSNQRRSSNGRSYLRENNSANVEVNSDSNSERLGSDGSDENGQAAIIPEFLFNASTSESSSDNDEPASIDSDVAREFNLDGDYILKYSDDDVAGDECRASETETSDDDYDDDDDMANFVVDDDEDIDEEESAEENESENEKSEMELLVQEDEIQDNEANESADCSNKRSKIESRRLESSSSDEEEREVANSRLSEMKVTNASRRSSSNKFVNNDDASMNSSTPKIRRRLSESTVKTTPKTPSSETKTLNTSMMNGSQNNTSMHESTKVVETPTSAVESSERQNTSAKMCSRSESLSHNPPINQSMQIEPTQSPEMKLLMKEKLNESLPTLKLGRRSLKASRRSSLMNVKESVDEHNEKSIEESAIEHVESPNQAKKKGKMHVNQSQADKSNAEFVIEDATVGKKKKKRNSKKTETDKLMSEHEVRLINETNKKQKVEVVDRVLVDAKKSYKKTLKSDFNSSLNRPVETVQAHSLKLEENKSNDAYGSINKTKKKMSKDRAVKFTEKKPLESAAISEIPSKKLNIKRLSEDVLENLSDIPARPKKRRKLDQQNVPSRSMFDVKNSQPQNLSIDNVNYIPVSASGGTSQFVVVNLKKSATKRSKKTTAAMTFRERMLGRNLRQPISAYLMYQQKLKASAEDKH